MIIATNNPLIPTPAITYNAAFGSSFAFEFATDGDTLHASNRMNIITEKENQRREAIHVTTHVQQYGLEPLLQIVRHVYHVGGLGRKSKATDKQTVAGSPLSVCLMDT